MRVVSALGLVMLAGCGLLEPSGNAASSADFAAFADRECREVARQRAADGAVNGYDRGMQALVARDTYNSCASLKQQRAAMPGQAATP
jgi:hypothetical protein